MSGTVDNIGYYIHTSEQLTNNLNVIMRSNIYQRVSNSTGQQQAEIKRHSFEGVLVSTLNAVEVWLLVRIHGRVLDVVLLAGSANFEGQPHVEDESSGAGQDNIAVLLYDEIWVHHGDFLTES
jgi:hypothetical protein